MSVVPVLLFVDFYLSLLISRSSSINLKKSEQKPLPPLPLSSDCLACFSFLEQALPPPSYPLSLFVIVNGRTGVPGFSPDLNFQIGFVQGPLCEK